MNNVLPLDTRILLTFLLDPDVRPTPKDMKLWVDVIGFIKSGARGGALSFFASFFAILLISPSPLHTPTCSGAHLQTS